jgi:hypothetical protein
VLGTFFAPVTVFIEFELIWSVGFVFFTQIVLSSADSAAKGDQYTRCFFGFGHVCSLSFIFKNSICQNIGEKDGPGSRGVKIVIGVY